MGVYSRVPEGQKTNSGENTDCFRGNSTASSAPSVKPREEESFPTPVELFVMPIAPSRPCKAQKVAVPRNILFAVVLCVFGMFLGARVSAEEAAEKKAAPALRSIFPLGGSPASRFEAVVRGEDLEGVHAVSFNCRNVTAEIKEVREVEAGESKSEPNAPAAKKEQEQPKTIHEVRLGIEITPAAEVGAHALRLVTPRGVSNALWLMVDSEPVILETDEPHATLPETQPVTFPVIVNGKLAKPGELDYYSFQVARGQELQLEVRVTELPHDQFTLVADPELILYKPTGSWFDPDRGVRLEVTDLWRPPLGDYRYTTSHRLPRVRRVFEEAGRYVAKVGTFGGQSGPDYSYQLRIVPVNREESQEPERWEPLVSAAHGAGPIAWENRSFTSEMGRGWLGHLSSRTPSAIAPPPELEVVPEKEPNDAPAQALEVPVPVIVQGVVGRPADEDWFQIQVKEGDKLAFEVETPYLPPPFFNPRVAIFDPDGKELANSIYRALGGDGDDWVKTLVPKILYTFSKAGEYRIQVRDLTSRVSGDDFTYRLVIRPQVPHVGEVAAQGVDRVHLEAGESRSLQVTAELEEGFQGEVALSVENLPPGVSAAPALGASDKENTPTAKPSGQIHRERHFPEKRSAFIMLMAASDAPPTLLPQSIRIVARPILDGKNGDALLAQEILLTVAGGKKQAEPAQQGANSP